MNQPNSQQPHQAGRRWLDSLLPMLPNHDMVKQRQARLLAQFVLVTALIFAAFDLFNWLTTPKHHLPWYGYVLLLVAFVLNRMNFYRLAAMLTVAVLPIVIFTQILLGIADDPIILLNYLVIGLLISSLLLSLRKTVVFIGLITGGILLLPVLVPEVIGSYSQIINPLLLFISTGLLLGVFMHQRDFIERHRRQELRQSEQQLQMALDAAKMGTWHWDMASNKVSWSTRTLEIFGLEPNAVGVTYESYLEAIHPDDRDMVTTAVTEAIAEKSNDYEVEHRILWPNGSRRWIHAKGSVYCDDKNHPIAMTGLISDTTSYRQAIDALRNSEERFRALAENVPGVIYLCRNNREWTMLYLNDRVEILTGYSKELFLSNQLSFTALYHPDDLAIVYDPVEDALQQNKPFSLTYRIKHKNGDWRWIEETGLGIEQSDGEWLLEGFLIDITERKLVESALRASEEMHRLLLTSIQSPVLALTEDLDILFCNEAYATMTNKPVAELEGKNLLKLFPDFQKRRSYQAYQTALKTSKPQEIAGWGNETYWHVHIYRTPWGILALSEDETERQQMKETREQLIEELAAKNQELERFTYTVSHDLKSPLVTVKGFMGFLEQDALKGDMEKVRKDLEHINTAVDRMQSLLNDLLELSRIGRVINPPQDVPFRDLLQEAMGAVAGQLASQNVQVSIKSDMPTVHGDRPRLVEVLQNLLDNAIKYMGNQPDPHIWIGCKQQAGETVFFVQDNGMGIAPHHQEKVFELFERLNRPGDGTGIGLAMVKRIIEVHNGRIWIESQGTQGTTFYFTLPLADDHLQETC